LNAPNEEAVSLLDRMMAALSENQSLKEQLEAAKREIQSLQSQIKADYDRLSAEHPISDKLKRQVLPLKNGVTGLESLASDAEDDPSFWKVAAIAVALSRG
jgi:restriction endonuclease S subunit